jgi:hypothetical protein
MKCDVKSSVIQMSEETFRELTGEVKERVAVDIELPKSNQRLFSSFDMWNIHRNRKLASSMFRR